MFKAFSSPVLHYFFPETLPKHVGLLGPRVVVQNTAWVFMGKRGTCAIKMPCHRSIWRSISLLRP